MLDPDSKTPGISLDAGNGALKIWGRSIPENSVDYYKPIFNWLEEYSKNSNDATEMIFQLEYFNTSSSKCILDILRKLELIEQSGKSKITIKWLYEEDDEDMMEAGDDYQNMVKLPFAIEQV